ncbi:MAG: ABC transporter ATP-binding protein [Chloroflexota bacterium]
MTDVSVRKLYKSYAGVTVLDGVDLDVPARGLTVILGPSGCGKTTLLRLIGGFDVPDRGSITLGGTVAYDGGRCLPPEERRVGYVAQEGALFPHLNVAQNVAFGLVRSLLPWRRGSHQYRRVPELLELVGLPAGYQSRFPHELSGGEQQRVAMARALAPGPGIVLLDEPFSSLDAGLREGTRLAIASALRASGTTTILVTHDQAEALSLGDHVGVMRGGTLAQVGAPSEVYRRPADLGVARFLGEANVVQGDVRDGAVTSELGTQPVLAGPEAGPVDVMIRPEQIVLAFDAPRGVAARVERVNYYGAHATVSLSLRAGTHLIGRLAGHAVPAVGADVHVTVEGAVMAYRRQSPHSSR